VQYPVAIDVSPGRTIEMAAEREIRVKEESQVKPDAHDTDTPHDSTSEELTEPCVIDEIEVEDLAVDGICGVY
jgi:hypothetical protein